MRYDHLSMLPERAFQKRAFGGMTLEGGGGGGQQQQPTTSTVTNTNIPEYAKPYVESMLGATQQQLFNMSPSGQITGIKPYVPYSTDPTAYVAGFSPLQQQYFQGTANLQLPKEYQAAAGMTGAAGAGSMGLGTQAAGAGQQYAQMATSPGDVQAYMSPYVQQALAPQLAEMQRQSDIVQQGLKGQAVQAGAFGGSRQALQAAEQERNKQALMGQAIGQGYQSAYDRAMQSMQYGAGLGLQGLQTGLAGYGQGLQAAGQLAGIGGQQLASQQGILGAQQQAGAQQQQQQQNIINQAIQNYATAQQYPQQQLAFMNAMLRGLPLQTATTQTYQAPVSPLGILGGIGGSALGAYMAKTGSSIFKEGGVVGYADGGDVDIKPVQTEIEQKVMYHPEQYSQSQIKQGIQDGIVSQLIGIPILQHKEALAQQMAMAQAMNKPLPQEPINREVMAASEQGVTAPMGAGIDQAQIPQEMFSAAGGGIVAFEDGGVTSPMGEGYFTPNPILEGMVKERELRGYKGDPNFAESPKGALGLMQIMPSTAMDPGYKVKNIFDMADDMGIKYKDRTEESAKKLLTNPKLNEAFGRSYLGAMERRFKGDPVLAAAAYNAGPGAVGRAGGVPNYKETQKYVQGIPAALPPAPQRSLLDRLSPISSAQAAEVPTEKPAEKEPAGSGILGASTTESGTPIGRWFDSLFKEYREWGEKERLREKLKKEGDLATKATLPGLFEKQSDAEREAAKQKYRKILEAKTIDDLKAIEKNVPVPVTEGPGKDIAKAEAALERQAQDIREGKPGPHKLEGAITKPSDDLTGKPAKEAKAVEDKFEKALLKALGATEPSEKDEIKAVGRAIMRGSAELFGARRGQEGEKIGKGITEGLDSYTKYLDNLAKDKKELTKAYAEYGLGKERIAATREQTAAYERSTTEAAASRRLAERADTVEKLSKEFSNSIYANQKPTLPNGQLNPNYKSFGDFLRDRGAFSLYPELAQMYGVSGGASSTGASAKDFYKGK